MQQNNQQPALLKFNYFDFHFKQSSHGLKDIVVPICMYRYIFGNAWEAHLYDINFVLQKWLLL